MKKSYPIQVAENRYWQLIFAKLFHIQSSALLPNTHIQAHYLKKQNNSQNAVFFKKKETKTTTKKNNFILQYKDVHILTCSHTVVLATYLTVFCTLSSNTFCQQLKTKRPFQYILLEVHLRTTYMCSALTNALKVIVHQKLNFSKSFTHPHVVSNFGPYYESQWGPILDPIHFHSIHKNSFNILHKIFF